jgi:TolA-binding protein
MRVLMLIAIIFAFVPAVFSQEQTQTAPAMQMETPASQTSGDFKSAMRLYRQKRYADAVAAFDQIGPGDPDKAAALYFAGYAHYVMKHHQEAVASFEKAFQTNPSFDPRPYFRR